MGSAFDHDDALYGNHRFSLLYVGCEASKGKLIAVGCFETYLKTAFAYFALVDRNRALVETLILLYYQSLLLSLLIATIRYTYEHISKNVLAYRNIRP